MNFANQEYSLGISTYEELYKWSIENIPDFWTAMWSFGEIVHSETCGNVVDDLKKMPGASWFQGAKLNYAENLLRFRDQKTAIVFRGESRIVQKLTYAELYDKVARLTSSLRDNGIRKGDTIVGFMPNMPEAVIAMLAATSIGAI
jgi:acetoacetyl-CoA synthetase